jgi:PAS domain S-box-containing protein
MGHVPTRPPEETDEAQGSGREARLAAIFARAPVGLSEIALDGRFVQVNDELCRLLGRTHRQLLALRVADVIHPEDVPASLRALAAVLRTGAPGSLDKRYVRPDGGVVWARSSLALIDDGQGGAQTVLAVTVELTEHTHAEAALEASEAKYRSLFDTMVERHRTAGDTAGGSMAFNGLVAFRVEAGAASSGEHIHGERRRTKHLHSARSFARRTQARNVDFRRGERPA